MSPNGAPPTTRMEIDVEMRSLAEAAWSQDHGRVEEARDAILAHLDTLTRERERMSETIKIIAGSFGCDDLIDDLPRFTQAMIAHSGTYGLLHEEVQEYRAKEVANASA